MSTSCLCWADASALAPRAIITMLPRCTCTWCLGGSSRGSLGRSADFGLGVSSSLLESCALIMLIVDSLDEDDDDISKVNSFALTYTRSLASLSPLVSVRLNYSTETALNSTQLASSGLLCVARRKLVQLAEISTSLTRHRKLAKRQVASGHLLETPPQRANCLTG